MKKTCTRCQERKPWSEFYAKTKWDDGTMRQPHSRCKLCSHEINAANREPQRAYNRRRYVRVRHDPELWEKSKAEHRERYARLREDPERYRARIVQITEGKRKREGWKEHKPKAYSRTMTPTAPIAAAVERSGMTATEIARAAGWTDEKSVSRPLGLENMELRTAARILDAIGLAPVDVGV
jgi:hypothetical protein